MKVKELRQLLKGLPADMDVVVDSGIADQEIQGYGSVVLPVKKAKKKLIKRIGEYCLVQSRPHKDEKAKLALVIE